MAEWKTVTGEEFRAWCLAYYQKTGRKLEGDVYGACEPPLVTYNDFTLGDWPESVVAKYRGGMKSPNIVDGSNFEVRADLDG